MSRKSYADIFNFQYMNILLGIQPTGRIHIWNYFGAIKKGLDMQSEWHKVIFLVANHHANASYIETINMLNALDRLWAIDYESQWPLVLELFYKLSHSTSVSELARLPQYQTKEQSLHMLSYPLLMACDIIMSDCDAVIVWDDQEPHMHFYREIARRNDYKVATTIKSDTPRIMSVKDPSVKMSKSLWDDHCIYIDDSLDEIQRKIKAMPTTDVGLQALNDLAKLFSVTFDPLQCWSSKVTLSESIYNYFNK